MSYLSGILRRIMTAANTSDDNLKIVSRVLSTGFIEDDQRYVSPVAALKIIESVLTSKSMSDDKSKDLIKVWSDFERIALSAEDITALQKTLNDAGKTNRAKMITVLKRKPKVSIETVS
ncbi:unnamed protein product [Anisakis simplex]|uniref:TerB domain-containing protein n=1 Tax=Anisakis simplex TaxID=6269 RepID=A0A0M3JHU5_ANISI|nr:unnamed protein product [Anisakis simplex]